MRDRKEQIQSEVSAEFARIEQVVGALPPGVMEMLQFYGGYDAAILQAQAYLTLTDLSPSVVSTGNSSNRPAL